MALSLSDQEPYNFGNCQFIKNELSQYFVISDEDGEKSIEVSYCLDVHDDYKPADYSIWIFQNPHLNAENDIYQVHCRTNEKRIGWIFPVRSLESKDHNFAQNTHFLKYAYVAFTKLLTDVSVKQSYKVLYQPGKKYQLTDFYDQDSIILVVCHSQIVDLDQFEPLLILPSLCKYGYHIIKAENILGKRQNSAKKSLTTATRAGQKVYTKAILNHFRQNNYIRELYESLLPKADNPVLRFMLLYQIIEILLEREFQEGFEALLLRYGTSDITRQELREKTSNLFSEKTRLSNVFQNCRIAATVQTDLLQACNVLLSRFGNERQNVADAFYTTRSQIVHHFSGVSLLSDHDDLIDQVNHYLEITIEELLLTYDFADSLSRLFKPKAGSAPALA